MCRLAEEVWVRDSLVEGAIDGEAGGTSSPTPNPNPAHNPDSDSDSARSSKGDVHSRAVYSFCMCPGGQIVPTAVKVCPYYSAIIQGHVNF